MTASRWSTPVEEAEEDVRRAEEELRTAQAKRDIYLRAMETVRPFMEGTDLTLAEVVEMLRGTAPWMLRIVRPSRAVADAALAALAELMRGPTS